MEIFVTKLKTPLMRDHSAPLSDILFTRTGTRGYDGVCRGARGNVTGERYSEFNDRDEVLLEFDDDIDDVNVEDGNDEISFPEMTDVLPEVTYGLKPRTSWMYRLMERAGIGTRSARSIPWFENDKEAFQHHAEYLQRLSKLREELIQQEQSNLANALDRLKMRSYGREYVYSQPTKEKKQKQRNSAQSEGSNKRNNLLTTFEKFQRMRPKKAPPAIMPLEGKSLIDTPISERAEKSDRHQSQHSNNLESRRSERSVDENVKYNLQRLTTHPIPSIPRHRRNNHRDIVLESSSIRRKTGSDVNNSNSAEDRILNMQKQKQKLMKMKHDAREAEKLKLMPQSFRLDTLSDEDKMNLEKLKDYYCIYYVPAPSSSPVDDDLRLRLPSISTQQSCNHSEISQSERMPRSSGHSNRQAGYRVTSDQPIPPTVCNCKCRMYVSGSKLESTMDQIDYSIDKTFAVNTPFVNKMAMSRETTRTSDNTWHDGKSNDKQSSLNPQEKMRIRVDMPAIVYNTVHTPEPSLPETTSGLVKAFKQKELRQKELSNLMEDVKELNKITENLSETVS